MPTYNYKCPKTGERFERFVMRSADRATQVCKCGEDLEQQINKAIIVGANSGGRSNTGGVFRSD